MKTKIIVAEAWPGAETYYYWGEARMEHMTSGNHGIPGLHPTTTRIDWIWVKRTVEYPQPEDFDRREITTTTKAIAANRKEIENGNKQLPK